MPNEKECAHKTVSTQKNIFYISSIQNIAFGQPKQCDFSNFATIVPFFLANLKEAVSYVLRKNLFVPTRLAADVVSAISQNIVCFFSKNCKIEKLERQIYHALIGSSLFSFLCLLVFAAASFD